MSLQREITLHKKLDQFKSSWEALKTATSLLIHCLSIDILNIYVKYLLFLRDFTGHLKEQSSLMTYFTNSPLTTCITKPESPFFSTVFSQLGHHSKQDAKLQGAK